MKIVKESVDRFFDYGLHIETRTIYLGDTETDEGESNGIGPLVTERLIQAFVLFNTTPEKPVRILMNSSGGSVFNGFAIYDMIKSSPCHVTIEVLGQCQSMGSLILQAADERIIHPNAVIMVHDGTDSYSDMHVRDVERWAEYGKKVDRPRMYAIFADRSKRSAHFWEKKCAHDLILTPQEAVILGLADKVFEKDDGNT